MKRSKMILKINLLSIIVTFILAFSFIYRVDGVKVAYNLKFIINSVILLIGMYKYIYSKDTNIRWISKILVKGASIPYIIASMYTILLFVMINIPFALVTRSISIAIQLIMTFMLPVSLILIFKYNALNIWYNSIVLSYLLTIIMAIKNIRMSGFLEHLLDPFNSTYAMWFEMHDLVISCGFILLYFIFYEKKKNELTIKNIIKVLTIIIIMYCGYKRIAFIALLVAFLIGLFIRKKVNSIQYWKMTLISLGLFLACLVYTWIVSNGIFAIIIEYFAINSMGRLTFYDYFKQFYEFNIFYLGQGFSFVEKHLESILYSHISGVSGVAALHNDLLRIYIELGFVGFISWFSYYIYWLPTQIMKKFSFKVLRMYYILICYAFITYVTDNTTTYYIFQSTWILIIGIESLNSNKDNNL